VIEAVSMRAQQFVELAFSGVSEGRMTNVVYQCQGLGEISVELQRSRYGTGDLRDFQGVCQAIPEMVGIARGEDLRFCLEAAEGARMNYAIAVAHIVVAVRMRRLGISPAPRFRNIHRIDCMYHETILCH